MARLSSALLAVFFCSMVIGSLAHSHRWSNDDDNNDDDNMDDNSSWRHREVRRDVRRDDRNSLPSNDWRIMGCKSKSPNDKVFKSCTKCVSSLPNDNMDFGCFDWCAKYSKDAENMEICSGCLLTGFTKKKFNPWACSQCIMKSKGNPTTHDLCVQCLNDGVNDFYCAKALDTSSDEDTLYDIYECLSRANNKNLALESCINKVKRTTRTTPTNTHRNTNRNTNYNRNEEEDMNDSHW